MPNLEGAHSHIEGPVAKGGNHGPNTGGGGTMDLPWVAVLSFMLMTTQMKVPSYQMEHLT